MNYELLAIGLSVLGGVCGAAWWLSSLHRDVRSNGEKLSSVQGCVKDVLSRCENHTRVCEGDRLLLKDTVDRHEKRLDHHSEQLDEHAERLVRVEGAEP